MMMKVVYHAMSYERGLPNEYYGNSLQIKNATLLELTFFFGRKEFRVDIWCDSLYESWKAIFEGGNFNAVGFLWNDIDFLFLN